MSQYKSTKGKDSIDQDNYRGGLEIPELKRFRGERALITEELNIVGR